MEKLLFKRTCDNVNPDLSGTITSSGGTSLVHTGTGLTKRFKGITAGTGISFTVGANDITIDNSSTGSGVTLSNAGGGTTMVNDGTGPTLAMKSLTAGTGISFTDTATNITITNDTNAAPTSIGANATATANSLTLVSNVLKAAVGGPTTPGVLVGHNGSSTNVAYGYAALNNYLGITGVDNTAIGYNAGASISSGNYNTFVGRNAGSAGTAIQSGTYNTIIGYNSGVTSSSAANRGVIGASKNSTSNGAIVFSSGYTILSADAVTDLYISATPATTGSAANLYINGSGQILKSTSSETQKKNIRPLEVDSSKLFLLQPKQFEMECTGECYEEPGTHPGCDYCAVITNPEIPEETINRSSLDQTHIINQTCPFHRGNHSITKIGFIAEDFEAVGLHHICEKNDGKIVDYDLKCLTVCLFNELKKLKEDVDILKNK